MFTRTARYYDLIYSFKDYAQEAASVRELIRSELPQARYILDVACGTGEHAKILSADFRVDGLDIEPEFINVARTKCPDGRFDVGDMRRFDLGKRYDVVQCLFSSIAYLTHGDEVVEALICFRNHLAAGGIVLVEPWFTPENWKTGAPHMAPPVDQPEIKICRMHVSEREGDLAVVRFHYLIATREGVDYAQEEHVLALYTVEQMLQFFRRAGLTCKYDLEGLSSRGVYLAHAADPGSEVH